MQSVKRINLNKLLKFTDHLTYSGECLFNFLSEIEKLNFNQN